MKKYLRFFLYYSLLYRIFQFFNKNKIVILTYHGFTDEKYLNKFENYHGKNINIKLFKSQIVPLKLLRSFGMNLLNKSELLKNSNSFPSVVV